MKRGILLLSLLIFSACQNNPEPPKPDACAGVTSKTHTVIIPKGAAYPPHNSQTGQREDPRWYNPAVLEINACDKVEWVNRDYVYHTATAEANSLAHFNTNYLTAGQTSTPIPFQKPGEYLYKCAPHAWMKGKIVVKKRP